MPNSRQKNSHSRRRQKRKAAPTSPVEKPVHATHRAQASARTVLVDFDAADLPANASGFGGLRQTLAQDGRSAESLCAQPGWRYIARPAEGGAVPILDRNRRMMVLIAGSPQELERWKAEVVGPLEEVIASGATGLSFTAAQLNHTRGSGFAALASGPSHGGGEKVCADCNIPTPAHRTPCSAPQTVFSRNLHVLSWMGFSLTPQCSVQPVLWIVCIDSLTLFSCSFLFRNISNVQYQNV
jgi:hypothetical protein